MLLTAREEKVLLAAYADLQYDLRQAGLIIMPEKVQKEYPYQYLGHELLQKGIRPQKLQIRMDTLKTLNDFQKLLGDINWLWPSLRFSTGQLKPLFDILTRNSLPNSPRKLTKEARECLELVQRALEEAHLNYIDYSKKILFLVFASKHSPTGVFLAGGTHIMGTFASFTFQNCIVLSTGSGILTV